MLTDVYHLLLSIYVRLDTVIIDGRNYFVFINDVLNFWVLAHIVGSCLA